MSALQSFAVGSLLAAYPSIIAFLRMKKFSLLFVMGMFIITTSFSGYFLLDSIYFSIFIILLGSGNQKLEFFGWCDRYDLSFGVFLYHAPILQVLISFNQLGVILISSMHMIFLLTLITLSMAMLSWISIEKPSKGLAKRITSNLSGT